MQKKTLSFIKIVILTAITALLGTAFSMNSGEVYPALQKPPLAPPGWLFPIVWSILYVCMALAMIFYFRKKGESPFYFWVYAVNLLLNAVWPLFFFTLAMTCASVFVLLALLVVNLILIAELRTVKLSFWLYLPYILWQLFALYLNVGVCILN